MRVIILEDEPLAAERLAQLLAQAHPSAEVLGVLESVEEAVQWFAENPAPNLAFFDIQLADGQSFHVFKQVEVNCPVIFTTAYDQYALQAFRVNSVDYLLKPVSLESLRQALAKYDSMKQALASDSGLMAAVKAFEMMAGRKYRQRFIVKVGHQLYTVPVEKILYFFSEHKTVWLKQEDLKKRPLDYTLEQLEGLLDPQRFFRVNRQFIVSIDAIQEAVVFSNSRLKIGIPDPPDEEPVLVSRNRVNDFKAWMGQ